jgi:hypothetical protein
MKKLILFVMLCMPVALVAQTQNGVTVSGLEINSGTVTFNVSWDKNAMPATPWSDTVWVFVDYNKNGVMTRLPLSTGATLTETSAPGVGEVIEVENNNQGVWVVGNAKSPGAGSFSASVKLLTATANLAGACAYASNYPPVGEYLTTDAITFTGTAPYTVVLENSSGEPITYTGYSPFTIPGGCTVKSFTDKTGAPGKLNCMPMTGSIDFMAQANVPKGLATSFEVLQQNLSIPNASAITYTWSAPNFNPSSGTGTSYAPTAPDNTGTYPVTLIAHSTGYCDLPASKTVTVIDCNPSLTYTLTASALGFCAGEAGVTFALSGAESGRIYQLYNGTTVMAALTGNSSAATFSGVMAEGIYTAKVLASAGGDCEAAMDGTPVTISRNSLPTAPVIDKPADVCLNSGNLVFTASTYSGVLLEWISNGGGNEDGNSITFNSSATGTKTVTARSAQTHTNAPVCYSSEVTQSASVNAIPDVPTGASSNALCGEGAVTFSATVPAGDYTIDWYATQDGAALAPGGSGVTSFAPTLTTTTTYYAQARNTATGCVSTTHLAVTGTVNPVPEAPAMGGEGNVYCGPGTITAAAGNNGNAIRWDDQTTASPRTVSATGTYYAVTTSAAGCTSSTATVSVTIHTVPEAPAMSGEGTQCGGTRPITATAGNGGNGIRWTDNSSTVTSRSVGTGTWNAVTTSADGCESAAAGVTVTIRQASGNGVQKDAVCGCAEGTSECSGTCLTTTSYSTTGNCTGSCNLRYIDNYNQCGWVNSGTTYDASCSSGCCSNCQDIPWGGKDYCASNCSTMAGSNYPGYCSLSTWTEANGQCHCVVCF